MLRTSIKQFRRSNASPRQQGVFLLLVEVNHPPTPCEPHRLTPSQLVDLFKPEFTCEALAVYKPTVAGSMYESIRAGEKFEDTNTAEIGYMSARFSRI